MTQNYGVLRVVRVLPPANATTDLQDRYPIGWLPEERLVHLLTRSETTIGRAFSNDLILMDPTVSREHARLVLGEDGWCIFNLTAHNIVRVNGRPVPSGGSLSIQPQDLLMLGSTMLQLIAPQTGTLDGVAQDSYLHEVTQDLLAPTNGASANGHKPLDGVSKQKKTSIVPIPQMQIPSPPHLRDTPPSLVSEDASLLSIQQDAELAAQSWERVEGSLLGAGVTMQFALPQRIGMRTRWFIAGVGVAILTVSAIVLFAVNSLIGISTLMQNGPSNLLAALTIPLVPAFCINLLVNFIDRFEREPWFLRLAAFLWGAIIAIPPALLIEHNVDHIIQNVVSPVTLVGSMLQGLNAGITEETVKGLGLLLLFMVLRDEFDNVTDGIVYGALIGAGFAMVENFVYFAQNSRNFLLILIVGRVVLGWLCHSTFTVCFGAALGYIRHTQVRWRQIVFPLLGYLCAVCLHSVFDFIDYYANGLILAHPGNGTVSTFALIAVVGDYIPPFIAQIILLYFLIKSLAHEAAVVREFLASEVSSGVVMVDEYALLQNSFQRTKAERRVLWHSGVKQWLRVKALYQTEIGLAFRKWHVSMGDKPKLGYIQPEDAYRRRIKRLRQQITAAENAKK
ncbi:MAG: PrsW family intramembrane metalloprotease [Chloroflexi bacterium]|nr:PrsW family intramembrane metalloprotease [Chloroflexota bacterium]